LLLQLYISQGIGQTNPPSAENPLSAANALPPPKSSEAVDSLLGAAYRTNVLASSPGPYHFVASFETFDLEGKPEGDGTMERWVAADGRSKTVTHFGNHMMTSFEDHGKNLYTDDGYVGSIMSYYARVFLDQPALPWFGANRRKLQTSTASMQGEVLDCGAYRYWIEPPGYPPMPMEDFCVSQTTGNMALGQTQNFNIRYEDYSSFLKQAIARRITASKGTHVRCRIKIDLLDQAALDEAQITPPPDASHTSPEPNIWATEPAETTPVSTPRIFPPNHLAVSHAKGLAELFVLISRTGTVIDVEPLFASSVDIEKFATQMVRAWRYKPVLRGGKPLEVITLTHLPLQF
jgi:hypothetical protein